MPAAPVAVSVREASVSLGNGRGEENRDEGYLHSHGHRKLSRSDFAALAWASIGVIFGDIATSPLYVYNSIFEELIPDGYPEAADVMGAASLIFWTVTLVVMVKYIGVVLLADDQGQGGTFALYSVLCRNMGFKPHGARGPATASKKRTKSGAAVPALGTASAAVSSGAAGTGDGDRDDDNSSDDESGSDEEATGRSGGRPWWRRGAVSKDVFRKFFQRHRSAQIALWGVAVIATAMLMGDGVLTPAMSVLSAVSGLTQVAPSLSQEVVIAVTIVVLVLVFAIQPMGTGTVGVCFAPIIATWLVANAAINCFNLYKYGGGVFRAINPAHIVKFFSSHGATSWKALGAVMLCVTGAEALFADLGHFSRGSISVGFGVLAYPCLVITYFGQAAYVIAHPQNTDAFWKSLPRQLLYPMLVLATLATIVASQALISGIFSIIRQAMILGAFPPTHIVHTGGKNPAQATQVYIPVVNVVLFALCCIVVVGFQDTVALGKAYGLAVMTDMLTTTCLVTLVMLSVWEVSLLLVGPFFVLFMVLEGGYWSANIIKVPQGGWFTLAVAMVVSIIMLVWWAGSRRLEERLAAVTRGAHIRLLACIPPPPLLLQPPPPPPSAAAAAAEPTLSRPRSTISSVSAAATNPKRLLCRLTSWALPPNALRRKDGNSSIKSKSLSAPAYPTSPHALQTSSLPLARLDFRKPLSLRARAASITRPGRPSPEMGMALLEEPEVVPNDSTRNELPPPPPLLSPPLPAAEEQASVAQRYGDNIGSSRSQTIKVVSETSFTPGTLALVLPADESQAMTGVAGGGATAARTAILLDGGADSDFEMGASVTAVTALQAPVLVPLISRLPGIGVYYMDDKVDGADSALASLPPVLVHFLRNVQAIHDVCVFLSVRNLPTPSVSRRHRLQVYTPLCASAPNFYQVVVRYGYLDVIDHGPAFMSELVDAVLKRLVAVEARAARGRLPRPYSGALLAVNSQEVRPFPEREVAATVTDGLADKPLARWGQQHNPAVMARLGASLRVDSNSKGGGVAAEAAGVTEAEVEAAEADRVEVGGGAVATGAMELDPAGSRLAMVRAGSTAVATAAAAAHHSALAAARAQVEEAVAAFMEARLHGVVYYGSRALIRVDERKGRSVLVQYFNWFTYGLLYKWLVAIAYVDMERWQVPPQQLVELGMPVYI